MTNILAQLKVLKTLETEDKLSLSKKVCQLISDGANYKNALYNIIRPVFAFNGVENYRIFTSDYSEMSISSYQLDGDTRIRIGFVFIPETGQDQELISENILNLLVDHVKAEGLEFIISDISVNSNQWVNQGV